MDLYFYTNEPIKHENVVPRQLSDKLLIWSLFIVNMCSHLWSIWFIKYFYYYNYNLVVDLVKHLF